MATMMALHSSYCNFLVFLVACKEFRFVHLDLMLGKRLGTTALSHNHAVYLYLKVNTSVSGEINDRGKSSPPNEMTAACIKMLNLP